MKTKRLLTILLALLLAIPFGAVADFAMDSDAIEKAAKSVLMLACSNKDGSISTGSGFVAFNSQTLVTNWHVMDKAKEIVASDDSGNLYVIDKVYCVSQTMDIAILGFSAPTALKALPLSTGEDLQRGQPVVTIGSPEGLKNTVSTGVVSAFSDYGGVPKIQISAPISHGSSGGALFDGNGNVVGVTSSGLIEGQNLNFAVRATVPLALYGAWKGETYTLNNWPKESPMDFTAGEKLAVQNAPAASAQAQTNWFCPACGMENSMNFCMNCGTAKPQWQCACGQMSVFKFCGACGKNQETLLNDLNAALTLMDQKEYEKAAAALEKLGEFNCGGLASQAGLNVSAEDQLQACYYNWGLQLEAAQNYTDAAEKYRAAGTYADAPQRITEMAYLEAGKAFDEGAYLTAAELYLALGDYKDSAEKAMESSYQTGLVLLANGEYEAAQEIFLLIPDYKEAAEKLKEVHYIRGLHLMEDGDYIKAIEAFKESDGLRDAESQIAKAYYELAVIYIANRDYLAAEGTLKRAIAYEETDEKLKELYMLRIQEQLQKWNLTSAISLRDKAQREGYLINDFPVFEVNQKNQGVASLLKLTSDLGFLELPKDEDTYKEVYLPNIITMEQTLGLTPDGIIYLSECDILNQTLYVGNSKITSKNTIVFNKLSDLGYLSLNYSQMRTYEPRYEEGIKKAEAALNLTVDGILTIAEQEIILSQKANPPQAVKSLKVSTKIKYGVTQATLSWSKSKDAAYYSIYRNGELFVQVNGTKYTFDVWSSNREGSYTVLAEKYTVSAEKHSPAKQVKMKK